MQCNSMHCRTKINDRDAHYFNRINIARLFGKLTEPLGDAIGR
jgi:hypothetical protein